MRVNKLLTLTWLVLLICAGKAYSQFDTASLLGRVTDSSGAVVAGANGGGDQRGYERFHHSRVE